MSESKNKLQVSYREGELRVHGNNSARFGTEIGIIVRHYAPLQYSGWNAVPQVDKNALYARVQVY